jgi:DNA-binding NtrC family response regulator
MATKLLIADDYHSLRRNVCKFLADEGYDVTGASDGAEAADLLKSEQFGVVISYIFMPRMNGFEPAELVESVSPATRVLLMSSFPYTPSKELLMRSFLQTIRLGSSVKSNPRAPAPDPGIPSQRVDASAHFS